MIVFSISIYLTESELSSPIFFLMWQENAARVFSLFINLKIEENNPAKCTVTYI